MVRSTASSLCLAALVTAAIGCADTPTSIRSEEDRRVVGSVLLLDRLTAGQPDERAAAARALGRIQAPSHLDGLASALTDEDRDVRLAAVFAIGQLGLVPDQAVEPRAGEIVSRLLEDPDAALVAAALNALGKLATEGAPERIAPFLAHADPAVRSEAAFALFRCRFAPLWRREVEDPPELPGVAAEALIAAMSDPDAGVRLAATYAFSRYGDTRARDALIEASTANDERIRLFAVRGLGLLSDEDLLPHLVMRLTDASPGVRVEAVGALRRVQAFDAVGPAGADGSFHVRAAVAHALGEAASARSLERLRRLAEDESVTVRVAAIDGLARRVGAPLLRDVERWTASEDWRIRSAAARAVAIVGDEARITSAFGDDDTRVRVAVLAGLAGRSGGDEVVAAAILSADLAVRGSAIPLVAERDHLDRIELMTRAYDGSNGEEWVEVRESVADALAEIGGGETLLKRILAEDPAPSVRGKAAAALGEPPPVPAPGPVYEASRWVEAEPSPGVQVDLQTRHGRMRIRLFPEEAPIHVASFLERVDAGFYDGLIWHRVVSNFVIQGGDPRGDGWGSGGDTVRDEINAIPYARGTLGMPKAGKDTGGCQLFITHVPTPHLDGNYTVFGRVVEGLEVIDAIEVGDAILSIRRAGV